MNSVSIAYKLLRLRYLAEIPVFQHREDVKHTPSLGTGFGVGRTCQRPLRADHDADGMSSALVAPFVLVVFAPAGFINGFSVASKVGVRIDAHVHGSFEDGRCPTLRFKPMLLHDMLHSFR